MLYNEDQIKTAFEVYLEEDGFYEVDSVKFNNRVSEFMVILKKIGGLSVSISGKSKCPICNNSGTVKEISDTHYSIKKCPNGCATVRINYTNLNV